MNLAKLLTLFMIVFFVSSTNVLDLSEAKRTDHISAKEEAEQIIDTFISEKGLAVQKNTEEYQELMKSILLGDYRELTGEGSKYINGQQELDLILEYASKQMSPLFKDYPVESEVQEAILLNHSALSIPSAYDIGNPTLTDIWIDPLNGDDANSGATRELAVATVAAAWNRIPISTELSTTGYRLQLVAGQHPAIPNYWESRWGTFQFPIILNAVDGAGTAIIPNPNLFDLRYVYLIGLTINAGEGGNGLHCELCNHILLRQMTVNGNATAARGVRESIKFNQSSYVYVEDSDIFGAGDNAVDFVAVQYGHFLGNIIHDAADWCMYLKGGSAYFVVHGNEFYDCGTGGFTVGQGTGFEFMVSPWLHYEGYDIKFVNNLIHDTEGAGMGVNGGYNVLMAYNTIYHVGERSHVLEVVFGGRGCDGNTSSCQVHLDQGGWGTTGSEGYFIPNRNVYIYNNIIYNPAGYQSEWQQLAIYGPLSPPEGSNAPNPATTDTNLQIKGNVIWNGPQNHPLGIEESNQGCQPSNPTCNETQLRAENHINEFEPQLVNPANGEFQPLAKGNLFTATTYPIPNFAWHDAPSTPAVPAGNPDNSVPRDFDNNTRTEPAIPGAFLRATPFVPSAWLYLPLVTR